jgi:hypothetical protein
MHKSAHLIGITLILVAAAEVKVEAKAGAETEAVRNANPRPYFQVGISALEIDDPAIEVSAEGEELEGEFPDKFYYLGGAAQTPWSDGIVGWGWEGGGYANWIVDDVSVFVLSSGGTTARISFDSTYFGMETFLGLYGSLQPAPWLRLYAGAGPSLMIGYLEIGDEEDSDSSDPEVASQVVVIDLNEGNFAYGGGYYGRVGVEVFFNPELSMGIGARYQDSQLNAGDSIGTVDLEGTMFMVSIGGRL